MQHRRHWGKKENLSLQKGDKTEEKQGKKREDKVPLGRGRGGKIVVVGRVRGGNFLFGKKKRVVCR